MNFVTQKIKNIFYGGFFSGFCVGCCFPNKIAIKFEDKYFNNIPIPLVTGLFCSAGLIFSPLLIINYFSNGVYFDKLIDKYDINTKRYHQYDGKNNKYAYPSLLILNIKSKNQKI